MAVIFSLFLFVWKHLKTRWGGIRDRASLTKCSGTFLIADAMLFSRVKVSLRGGASGKEKQFSSSVLWFRPSSCGIHCINTKVAQYLLLDVHILPKHSCSFMLILKCLYLIIMLCFWKKPDFTRTHRGLQCFFSSPPLLWSNAQPVSTVCVLWRPPRRMPGDSAASPPSTSRTRSCAECDRSCTRPARTARLGWFGKVFNLMD